MSFNYIFFILPVEKLSALLCGSKLGTRQPPPLPNLSQEAEEGNVLYEENSEGFSRSCGISNPHSATVVPAKAEHRRSCLSDWSFGVWTVSGPAVLSPSQAP